jgi:hypothetical protein
MVKDGYAREQRILTGRREPERVEVVAGGLGPGGEWLRPMGIVSPRFARLNLTVNF